MYVASNKNQYKWRVLDQAKIANNIRKYFSDPWLCTFKLHEYVRS